MELQAGLLALQAGERAELSELSALARRATQLRTAARASQFAAYTAAREDETERQKEDREVALPEA